MDKAKFVIWPRSNIYWLEAHYPDGAQQKIESHRTERDALVRLRELQKRQDSRIMRQAANEASRWNGR